MVERTELIKEVTDSVIKVLSAYGIEISTDQHQTDIPISVSARHLHLSPEHVEYLFGKGYQLTPFKEISQPHQYACKEQVTISGPKGQIERVRVLGPSRGKTQVEVSKTDARVLGLQPPVRSSGDLADSSPVTITGPTGTVLKLSEGCIIADRHIHMTPADAAHYGVKDGDRTDVAIDGDKPGILKNVAIRVKDTYALDMHVDTDDGNAFLIEGSGRVRLLKKEEQQL
ncbi:propanediol utilization phosphotransacylase [Jeotgalibacillus alimentarius]|uniref:Phosphate propanoyltransferase n=1 Tax=Jeotgalibacillus alimentarius TaxID=135826 RepID=A0A0C2R8S6_9BACL|nr:phosphate propanoyltransferase [Jeotgalibacillus alimentarius]KIL46680.1 propanediol utilization phosphotransacylase [Jeotgalibacillus alimentarius]